MNNFDQEYKQPLKGKKKGVSKREIDAINRVSEQRELLRPNLNRLILSIILFAWFNLIWYYGRSEYQKLRTCDANFPRQLGLFACCILSYDILFRMILQCKYRKPRYEGNPIKEIDSVTSIHLINYLTILFLWFIISQSLTWPNSSQGCVNTNYFWFDMGYYTYLVLVIFVGIPSVCLSCIWIFVACFLPCTLCIEFSELFNPEVKDDQDNAIASLIKRGYDPSRYVATAVCEICKKEFGPDDTLTPLPCNVSHYFHAKCMENHMQEKQDCPICHTPIDAEKLAIYEEQVDTELLCYAEAQRNVQIPYGGYQQQPQQMYMAPNGQPIQQQPYQQQPMMQQQPMYQNQPMQQQPMMQQPMMQQPMMQQPIMQQPMQQQPMYQEQPMQQQQPAPQQYQQTPQ